MTASLLCLLSLSLSVSVANASTPTAEAGLSLLAEPGSVVILNGSASEDLDGDPLAFAWTQIGGPPVELSRAETDSPEFTIPEGGTYRFELIVTDGVHESDPDVVEIIAPYQLIDDGYEGCSHLGGAGALWPGLLLIGLARRRA